MNGSGSNGLFTSQEFQHIMRNMTGIWEWISSIGTQGIPENEKRSVLFLNRINFLIILISFIGFLGTFTFYTILGGNHLGIGEVWLVLMV